MFGAAQKALDIGFKCGVCNDILAGIIAVFAVSTAWMEWIDLLFKLIIGGLTIVLLILRVRAHLRPK